MSREHTADVVVVGLGAWGSAAAWQLADAGHDVIGIDRFSPPHERGSTHGRSRAFRRRSTHRSEAELLAVAEELFEQLERDSGRSLFTRGAGYGSRSSRSAWRH